MQTTISSMDNGGNSRSIEIHLHNEVGGREFQRVVRKMALEDFELQI